MSNFLSIMILILGILASSYANAHVHTWHMVKATSGVWDTTLSTIHEEASFVDSNEAPLTTFEVSENKPIRYGAIFGENDDFNVTYTLTLVERSAQAFSAKACVFVITARGPANPDVRYMSYHNAKCGWVINPNVGEDFVVE